MAESDPSVPLIAAPMAGGPSTPELVAAVTAAGGRAFLAGGYRTPDDLAGQVRATRELGAGGLGVNLFVPAGTDRQALAAAVAAYRERLAPLAQRLGVDELPQPRWDDTDHWEAKLDLLVGDPVETVSFTFGCPPAQVVRRLQAAGSRVVVTVTGPQEARAAAEAGVDGLCLQGAQAGGHRGTHRVADEPDERSWEQLLPAVRAAVDLPVTVAGGVVTADQVRAALTAGASAVQCGTAFLLTDEAGTGPAHRAALTDPGLDTTTVTRAFSGRPARGLRNAFVAELDGLAPAAYPVVDQLTKPLRAAAAARQDPRWVSAWAGTGWRQARTGPAAQVVAELAP